MVDHTESFRCRSQCYAGDELQIIITIGLQTHLSHWGVYNVLRQTCYSNRSAEDRATKTDIEPPNMIVLTGKLYFSLNIMYGRYT